MVDAVQPEGDATNDRVPDIISEFRLQPTTVAGVTGLSRRTTITFYLTEGLRNRARSAYRATSFEEKDSSWSEMLNKALVAEIERREAAYNDGTEFAGSDEPLTPGRPIGF
ncbi:ParB family protein [Leifsonia sp. Le1]|uniref:ParB family protein n=1 Tax=Leifsonia sp. Le1 TaxID=3404918 RepID=UPI003EC0F754